MRLPSSLLGRVRVGVGVGAVMLGGCDLAASAQEALLGSEPAPTAEAQPAEVEVAPAVEAEPEALEPMLLERGGMASVVEQTVARSQPEGLAGVSSEVVTGGVRVASPEPPPIADLGRPAAPEGSRGFVPYDDGRSTIASAGASAGARAPIAKARPSIRPRPRPRPQRPVQAIDEPCDPGLVAIEPPDGEWECLACGRG